MENSLVKTDSVELIYYNDALDVVIDSKTDFSSWKILNFENVDVDKIHVICKENSKIKLIIESHKDVNVEFDVKNNVNMQVNFLSIDECAKGKYKFIVRENASVIAAMADFSKGNIDFAADFDLIEPNARAEWHLATLGAEKDSKKFNINFNHQAKNTFGIMSNYGVVEDESFMHFKGISHIKNGAVNSKTYQSAKIMVFDENCRAKANPILKIDENNIEASHAAIVGRVNDDHMFYLCSRGINETEAKQLITFGYLKPITKYFESDECNEKIINGIEKRL